MATRKSQESGPDKVKIEAAMRKLEESQRVLDYSTAEYTIEILVQKFGKSSNDEESEIYVPLYQRSFNWDERRQARFIESLLIGLPIPFLFFADKPDGRLEVVDGNQRLSTCRAFLDNELLLVGLERVAELDGFHYRDLTTAQQRRFRNRTIRSVVLSQNASDEDLRDLFDRINTGSLTAESVEIRRGAHKGKITDLIDRLATDPLFMKLCPITEAARRKREGEELITRFFAFGDGLENYEDYVAEFLDEWLKDRNAQAAKKPALVKEYEGRFKKVMGFVGSYFPFGFAKSMTAKTTPRGRFDAIAVGAWFAIQDDPDIIGTGPRIPPGKWISSDDDFFTLTTSGGANVQSRIKRRTQFVRYMILGNEREARLCAKPKG
jgi:hypothetical protein